MILAGHRVDFQAIFASLEPADGGAANERGKPRLLRSGWEPWHRHPMVSVRRLASLSFVLGIVVLGSVAEAQPRPAVAPFVGTSELIKLTTPAGFIDDVRRHVIPEPDFWAVLSEALGLGCRIVKASTAGSTELNAVSDCQQGFVLVGSKVPAHRWRHVTVECIEQRHH